MPKPCEAKRGKRNDPGKNAADTPIVAYGPASRAHGTRHNKGDWRLVVNVTCREAARIRADPVQLVQLGPPTKTCTWSPPRAAPLLSAASAGRGAARKRSAPWSLSCSAQLPARRDFQHAHRPAQSSSTTGLRAGGLAKPTAHAVHPHLRLLFCLVRIVRVVAQCARQDVHEVRLIFEEAAQYRQ